MEADNRGLTVSKAAPTAAVSKPKKKSKMILDDEAKKRRESTGGRSKNLKMKALLIFKSR